MVISGVGGIHMVREYLEQNVYEALQDRLKFTIFMFLFPVEKTAACS